MSNILNLLDQYGYLVFFAAFSLGPFGIPIPNEVTILTGAMLGVNQVLNAWFTYLSMLSGLMIAVTVSYGIGRFFGPLLEARFQAHRYFNRAQALLDRYGNVAMGIAFFVPVVRYMMPALIGMSRVRPRIFVFVSYSSAVLWTAIYFGLGTLLGGRLGGML